MLKPQLPNPHSKSITDMAIVLVENHILAKELWHQLSINEVAFVAMRFGLICKPKTLKEIADLYKTTTTEIQIVEHSATRKLSKSTWAKLSKYKNHS